MEKHKKNDEVLLSEIKQDNRQAFETLFRKYHTELYNFARRYVKRDAKAEDVVHDVFLKFWDIRKELTHGKGVKTYFFRAIRNEAINYSRHLEVKQKAFEEISYFKGLNDNFSSPAGNINTNQLEQAIEEAFEELPPRCREIFLLSRDDGLTYKEIASVLNISVKTVETQMGRALKKLRISLADFLPLLLTISLTTSGLLF